MKNTGEIIALITAVCWTVTVMNFEAAGKRIGSLNVNFIRLLFSFIMSGFYLLLSGGHFIPFEAGKTVWFYLGLSGLAGFAVGDIFLFQAFILIGARLSMLVYASVPVITGIFGFLFLNEYLGIKEVSGIMLTVGGIVMVLLSGNKEKTGRPQYFFKGIIFAVFGSMGQAAGLIISKYGMRGYDNAFGSNMIRIIAGMAGFAVIITFMKRWRNLIGAFTDVRGMIYTGTGAFFGPFLGVALLLVSIKLTSSGVAAAIVSIVPVLIIPPAVLIYKEKITIAEAAGAVLAVSGVFLLFL